MKKSFKICVLSFISALVFISTYIKIDIYFGPSRAMLGFGNVFCILSGFILDPISAGICSGLGSAIFDLSNPQYIMSTPFTFFSKFLMAFICSKFSKKSKFLGAFLGTLVFIVLRIIKIYFYNFLVFHLEFWPNVIITSKLILTTTINCILAIICAFFLEPLFKKAIERSNLKEDLNDK